MIIVAPDGDRKGMQLKGDMSPRRPAAEAEAALDHRTVHTEPR